MSAHVSLAPSNTPSVSGMGAVSIVPAPEGHTLGEAIVDHHLFDLQEEGFGLLQKARVLAIGQREDRELQVLAAWLALDAQGVPVGVALVTRSRVLKDPFLRGHWLPMVDVYVRPSHRGQEVGQALVQAARNAAPWALAYHTDAGAHLYARAGLVNGYDLWALMDEEGSWLSLAHQLRSQQRYRANLAWWARRHSHDHAVQAQARTRTFHSFTICHALREAETAGALLE